MGTTLKEMQFELLPAIDAAAGQVFGIGSSISLDDGGFDPGDDDWSDQDQENPSTGATAFGRDRLLGPTWAFDLHVNESDVPSALSSLGEFKAAWRAKEIRETPGAVLPLRYRIGDRYRKIYGRPRRLAAPPDNKILSGYIPITADFKCVDGYTYDDVEQSTTMTLNGGTSGGFIFPVVFPSSTIPTTLSTENIFVGGDADTYPVVRFTGPVTNPSLELDDWIMSLQVNIEAGDYVEVDLRPWAKTALLNGVTSVAGTLGRRQYMKKMKFSPGPKGLTFRGTSAFNTATCTVRWANAHNSI